MRLVLAGLMTLIAAAPVLAQDSVEDWELIQGDDLLAARVRFDNGLGVVVRCHQGGLETFISGLPADPEVQTPRRTIGYAFGGSALRPSTWQTGRNGSTIFADVPAAMARRFRSGGELQLQAGAVENGPARRYVIDLPPSSSSIDQVLTACDRPILDPRDELRRDETSDAPGETQAGGSTWRRTPLPAFPRAALDEGVSGMVVLSCLVGDRGRLDDCVVEVERPVGQGFGEAALRATRQARLEPGRDNPSDQARELVTFTIRFLPS